MYCVIDRDALLFLPIKHQRVDVVCDLVWLQVTSEAVHIFDIYAPGALTSLTDMELMMLYRNTTGEPKPPRMGQALRNILLEMCDRIEPQVVQAARLAMQADKVTDGDTGKYVYNPDALVPSIKAEGFTELHVKMPRSDNETLIATQVRVRPAKAITPAAPPVIATQAASSPAPVAAEAPGVATPWNRGTVAQEPPATPPSGGIISPWLKKS